MSQTESHRGSLKPPQETSSTSHTPKQTHLKPVTVCQKGKEYVPLKVISFNARGLSSKYAHLHSLIYDHDPDIIAITETFLDNTIPDTEFTPSGYKCFRKDRNLAWYREGTYINENRGGVLLLIKEELNPVIHVASDVKAEILWITTSIDPKNDWIFGVCYRPEVDEDFILPKITESINAIDHQNVMLLGDFNFRCIDWESGQCSRPLEQLFIDTINDNLLEQIIDIPTRGANILDLAFVGDPSVVQSYDTLPPFGTSDHKVVTIDIRCMIPRITRSPRKIYLYSKGNYEEMDQNLTKYDWDDILKSKDVNVNWEMFKEIYQENIDLYVPTKMVKPGQRLIFPWVRYRSVRKSKNKTRKAKVRARVSGLSADQFLAEEAKVAEDASILAAKAHYENKLVGQIKDDPKRFFNYTRHFTRSSSSIDVLEQNGSKITEDGAKADLLNSFLCL